MSSDLVIESTEQCLSKGKVVKGHSRTGLTGQWLRVPQACELYASTPALPSPSRPPLPQEGRGKGRAEAFRFQSLSQKFLAKPALLSQLTDVYVYSWSITSFNRQV